MLHSGGPGPYAYGARYDLALDDSALIARLEITNRSPLRLPFGAGFHPRLPRTSRTTLQASADAVWLEDERYKPIRPVPLDEVPDFDFRATASLPARWINNSFIGWNGLAEINLPERQLSLVVQAPETQCYHVYSRDAEATSFCFETETQIPDAANLLPEHAVGAVHWLRQGETLTHEVKFVISRQ